MTEREFDKHIGEIVEVDVKHHNFYGVKGKYRLIGSNRRKLLDTRTGKRTVQFLGIVECLNGCGVYDISLGDFKFLE